MGKRVLVVVDMQKDFVDGSLGSKEAVSIVPAVVKKARDFDGRRTAGRDPQIQSFLGQYAVLHPDVHRSQVPEKGLWTEADGTLGK